MKTTIKKFVIFTAIACIMAVGFAFSAFAVTDYTSVTNFGSTAIIAETDKDPMTYKVGETMTFNVSLQTSTGELVSVPYFSYSFSGDDGASSSGRVSGSDGKFTVTHKITCPGFVRLTVKALDADGNEINSSVAFNGGACAEWEKIETAMAEPDDFDEYWEECLAELDTVAPTVYNLVKASESNDYYDVYDLYINCVGSKNFLNTAAEGEEPNGATYVAGKLTVPKNLDPGSAKFYLNFQGAGVYTTPGVSKKAGYVTLCVYAHSIEMSREASYYSELNTGLLSGYMSRARYNDNADESYTKYMVLRDLQAVRFLKTYFGDNEWDRETVNGIDTSAWKGLWNGKDIELYGQSQGGFQCIAVAALDHDISLCNPWVPCWCDMYAKTYFPNRRTMGLVYEHYSQKYFDSVALGKRIVCRTVVDTGFGDDTCPTTGVIAAYNAMTCEKVLNIYQGMPHNCSTKYPNGMAKAKYTSGEENFKIPYNWTFTFDWEISDVSDSSVLMILEDGKTVKALKKGTATVNFTDSDKYSVTVEVENAVQDLIITDGSLSSVTAEGIIRSIYTRTHNTAFVADSWDDYSAEISAGNIEKGITYYVISNLEGTLEYTAEEMYARFEASGADYLVMLPGAALTSTTASMYAMQVNTDKYPNAYVCDNGTAGDEYTAGRNAGNNIVSIIEKNKPVLDADYKVYDANTGNEIKALSVLSAENTYSIVIIPNQSYSIINGLSVSTVGLTLDSETLTITGDDDGGVLVINGREYTIYADAFDSGIEDGYSWVLDSEGKLTVLSDGEISDSTYPWASYSSLITEIDVATGATKIASGAFSDMSALTILTLPYTLLEISDNAVSGASSYTVYGYENNEASKGFASNAAVTFVSLGACGVAGESLMWEYNDGVLYITGNGTTINSGISGYGKQSESSWYDYYSSITKVIICENVTTIDAYSFHNMKALTTVEITENLTTIAKAAFENSSALDCIYLAGNDAVSGTVDLSYVTTMSGGYQFDGCSKIADIILSKNLTTGIGDKFIGYNTSIKSLTIPASVPSVHKRALYRNSALKELTVLGTDTTLPQDMLTYNENNTSLTTIYGRAGSTAETFAKNSGITFIDLTGDQYDGEIVISGECGENVYFKIIENETSDTFTLYFYGDGTTIVSGCTAEGCSEAKWADYADLITDVVFRGNINSVGAYTLSGLSALENIIFDNSSITSICANAFTGSGISGTFNIPADIRSIEANAFVGLSALTAIAVHNEDAVIDAEAFVDCGITTVYGFYRSTAESFAESSNLTFKNINDILPVATGYLYTEYNGSPTVSTIWYYDKANKTLSFVSDRSGWNETGRIAYATDGKGWSDYITEIEKVIIGDELDKISQYAFQDHTALKVVELSSGISQIDISAFNGCTSLDTIYVRGNVPIEGVADLHNITTVSKQKSVFVNCAFDTVIFNDAETAIMDGTFSGTAIVTVIGNSDSTEALAKTLGASSVLGYVNGNTVWSLDEGVLTVYAMGTPEAISDLADYTDSVTKIVFESGSDISVLNTGVFDGFTGLTEVLFRCDAPDSAASSCFGTNNTTVYYAKGISSFSSPIWNGYVCLEEGSALGIVATGFTKTDEYTWTLDDLGTLTISGTGDGTLDFESEPNWDNLTPIPWNSYRGQIIKVIIEEETGITKISSPYALSNLSECTAIIIPSTLTNLGAYNIFSKNPKLNTIAVNGNDVVEGVIDLRNITHFNDQLFEASFDSTTPSIYLPAEPVSLTITKWASECTNLTFVTYPTCKSATYIRALAAKQSGTEASSYLPDKVTLKYYTVEQDASLVRNGSQTIDNGYVDWIFDDKTATLTFTKGATAPAGEWNEFYFTTKSTEYYAWKVIWKDAVEHIEMSGNSKLQFSNVESPFAGMVNLKSFYTSSIGEFQHGGTTGLFEGCTSLTTLGKGSGYTEGVIDLSVFTKYTSNVPENMFKDCKSIKSVIFADSAPSTYTESLVTTAIFPNMFSGCTSLKNITIPSWVTTVGSGAFSGCTALVNVTLECSPTFADSSVFPDNEGQGLLVYCCDTETTNTIDSFGYTDTIAVYAEDLATAIAMNGYSVRLEKHNGLRSLFSFDNNIAQSNADNGYTLVEYGAIVAAGSVYDEYGCMLTLSNGEYVTPVSSVFKFPVFDGEKFVSRILETSNDDVTRFAATVIKFESNFTTDIYFCGYEIWRTPQGAELVYYTDCANNDYDKTNIYEISLNMYKKGLVNFENDTQSIVWDTLKDNGVVTLKAGTDYTYVEGSTDLDGNSFADSFVFSDVPACTQSYNAEAGTISFTKSGLTITLLKDGDDYVAVYRGSGKVPTGSAWSKNTVNQLSSAFHNNAAMVKAPNPRMSSAASKIKTIILDYGITEISTSAFAQVYSLETLVYPTTLEIIRGTQFVSCSKFSTAYCADISNSPEEERESGLIDFSSVDSVEATYMFTSCSAIKYVHLPANIGTTVKGIVNQCTSLMALWCGEGERADGLIDLSKTSVSSMGDYAFQYTKNITTVKFPESISALYDTKDGTERHVFANTNISKITTENEVPFLTDYVTKYGETYNLEYTYGSKSAE